jgi:hypothetical protein
MGQMCTLIHTISHNRISVLIHMGSKFLFSDGTMNKIYLVNTLQDWSQGSSVSIVSDYRQDDRVRSLTEAEDFSSILCVQTGSGEPPVQWVPGGPFPRGKARLGCDADHSPPSSAEVKNK